LSVGLWTQYYLDNFATVKEAVEFTEKTPFWFVTGTLDGIQVGAVGLCKHCLRLAAELHTRLLGVAHHLFEWRRP
jgi:hypothetical protein